MHKVKTRETNAGMVKEDINFNCSFVWYLEEMMNKKNVKFTVNLL